jgi:hypothetical protein
VRGCESECVCKCAPCAVLRKRGGRGVVLGKWWEGGGGFAGVFSSSRNGFCLVL